MSRTVINLWTMTYLCCMYWLWYSVWLRALHLFIELWCEHVLSQTLTLRLTLLYSWCCNQDTIPNRYFTAILINSAEKVHVLEELHVTASQIPKESLKDQQLSAIMKSIQQGHWPVTSKINLTPFVTWHEIIGLMCTQNLTTFWTLKFHNFVIKHSISKKRLVLVQQTMT